MLAARNRAPATRKRRGWFTGHQRDDAEPSPAAQRAPHTNTATDAGTDRTKSADDPRDEDVAFFYAEEANHDAEDAIFEELYGTSTTTVPPPGW